jgi:RNA polymerase-interacting CarD/CdnL/TRCF family regulator
VGAAKWPFVLYCCYLIGAIGEKALTFREGNKVIYPRLGICRVAGIVEQTISGLTVKLYQLKPLDFQESTTVLVPVNKAEDVGVRKLIDKADIPK